MILKNYSVKTWQSNDGKTKVSNVASTDRKKLRREFHFTEDDFNYIRELVYKVSGIQLSDVKQDMVYSRLARRLRILKLTRFSDYCQYIEDNYDQEITFTINAITTNLTHFFREEHHFDTLKQRVIPELIKNRPRGKRVRIWSAGCSTGEEPYSIAISLLETLPNHSQWDAKILATDLDSNVVETCKAGIYDRQRIDPVESGLASKWFCDNPENTNQVIVDDQLREHIVFKRLNLMNDWPINGPFDVIFCRNVLIYFDKPTQQKLFSRFYELLAPEGYLFLGHSEQLGEFQKYFTFLGKTSFKKI